MKNKTTICKTKTNIGAGAAFPEIPKELFEVHCFASPSFKSFGYEATCVRTGKSFGSDFRGKYAEQNFDKALEELGIELDREWYIFDGEIDDIIEACGKNEAVDSFHRINPDSEIESIKRGGYAIQQG